jgi:hypothetical protein
VTPNPAKVELEMGDRVDKMIFTDGQSFYDRSVRHITRNKPAVLSAASDPKLRPKNMMPNSAKNV